MQTIMIEAGVRFGRLVVQAHGKSVEGEMRFPVQCDCGKRLVVRGTALRSGHTLSCGCLGRERRLTASTKHGLTPADPKKWHPLYRRWLSMKQRCYNENFPKFEIYGARGIKVCKRWREDFTAFLADVGMPPSPKHTLERKNNDGDYTPTNVMWALPHRQSRNKRTNVMLTFDGKTQCLTDWAEERSIKTGTLSARIRAGWTIKRALNG